MAIEWSQLEPRINEVKHKIQEVYFSMKQSANPLLPPQQKEFLDMEQTFNQQEMYDVVVCGEVKKGKTSFVNAVIGEEILPVDTKVATCQVFRIINSDNESYSLVFIDGSKQPINKEELKRYGSQVAIDEDTLRPIFDKTIDHIEVCHPIAFLPKQVVLVDTPGLGSVYAAHEQITRRYLRKAAAVIFVVDPQSPITASELEAINIALDVTPYILFVLTKIDNYSPTDIQSMLMRDHDLLRPLSNRMDRQRIVLLPMSSKHLAAAGGGDGPIYEMMSRFDDVKNEMLAMMFRSCAMGKSIEDFNVLVRHDAAVKQAIIEQEHALQNNSLADLVTQKNQLLSNLIAAWGPNGSERRKVEQTITVHIAALQNQMTLLLNPGGPIFKEYSQQILSFDLNADTDILKDYVK